MLDIKDIQITPEILKFIAEIDEFKGKWQATQSLAPDRLDSLKKIATIESVGSSTRIEGSKLSDEQVEGLLANIEIKSFESRDEQEVAGYASAMNMVFENFDEIQISENYIKQIHKELLKYSHKDSDHRGNYKTIDNHVEAFDAGGKNLGVIFETATPFETPQMMADLVAWYDEQAAADELHPLIIIGIFVVVFLAIHPFKDGNGRLSRVLTTLLLIKHGYGYMPYSSMESIIESSKDSYYLALRRTQQTIKKNKQDWQPWLGYFLHAMIKQKDILQQKLEAEKQMADALPLLSRQILDASKSRGEISVKDIEEITGANRNTIKLHLKNLTAQNYLKISGKGRGVRYIIS